MIPNGLDYSDGILRTMSRYLDFFERSGSRCTFFTLGSIARSHPELIREIVKRGHEIACHGNDHIPLDRHDPNSFRSDLERNLDQLHKAGANDVYGFRAPMLSITQKTSWAYEILENLSFRYSSSVLPARNPLYGWPEFSYDPCRTETGFWEIPLSLTRLPVLNVPFVGGVYFRNLPFMIIKHVFQRESKAGRSVTGYSHPFDIDTDQECFMHPELQNNRFYNWLMYRNRSKVFPRLEKLLASGIPIRRYIDFVTDTLEGNSDA